MRVEDLYPPFPVISIPDFHSVKVEWFECLEELAEEDVICFMEVTLRKKDGNKWEQIYFGNGTYCVYHELEPGTEYELRLRLKWEKDFGPFGSIEVFETPQEPDTAFDLHKAIKFEDMDTIQRILSTSNAKVEVTDQMDYTPLMAAVSRNSKSIINMLLNAGANVNTANKLGKTALMLSANKGFIDIVDILLKRGASVDAKDIHGMTALFYAVDGEFSNVVRTLVRAGAFIDEVDSDNQYTPLIRLACLANNGNPRVGAALLECGANVNHQDKYGQTPLIHCAFHRNHADLAKVLLQHGADWRLKNKKMSTAMDIAKALENTNFLQVIESFKKKK